MPVRPRLSEINAVSDVPGPSLRAAASSSSCWALWRLGTEREGTDMLSQCRWWRAVFTRPGMVTWDCLQVSTKPNTYKERRRRKSINQDDFEIEQNNYRMTDK